MGRVTMNNFSFFHSCTLVAAIAGIAGMLLWPMTSSAAEHEACSLPESLVFGEAENRLMFEADKKSGREAPLERIDFLTTVKWSLGLLIPGLMGGDVSVHLYEEGNYEFLANYADIENTRFVKFFLACEDDGEYVAIPATISRFTDGSAQGTIPQSNQDGYIGMTFRPKDTTPYATLKGDLFAFRREDLGM